MKAIIGSAALHTKTVLKAASMASTSTDEVRRKEGKPAPTVSEVLQLTSSAWKLTIEEGSITQLESYDDANFYIRATNVGDCEKVESASITSEYLIKFYNAVESNNPEMLQGLSLLLREISCYSAPCNKCGFGHPTVPVAVAVDTTFNARSTSEDALDQDILKDIVYSNARSAYKDSEIMLIAARLFRWIPGPTLNKAGQLTLISPKLMVNLGFSLGSLTNSLQNFDHPTFHREHSWDLRNFTTTYSLFSQYVQEQDVADLIKAVHITFEKEVLPSATLFRKSIIMGDCNDANVILNEEMSAVTGIIDFGDAVYTWSVNEIAIATAYALLTPYGMGEPLECMAYIFGGYMFSTKHCQNRESEVNGDMYISNENDYAERQCLHTLICVRLCISIMIGAFSISKDPSNEYLKLHSHPAKQALRMLNSGNEAELSKESKGLSTRGQVQGKLTANPSTTLEMYNNISKVDLSQSTDSASLVGLLAGIVDKLQLSI